MDLYQIHISNPATEKMERFIMKDQVEAARLQHKMESLGYYASEPIPFDSLDYYQGLQQVFRRLGVRGVEWG